MSSLEEQILKEIGDQYLLSSELYERLGRQGLSSNAARTAVSRLIVKKVIRRAKLPLSRNDRIITQKSGFSSPALLKKLLNTNFGDRPAVARVVNWLSYYNSIIPASLLVKIASLKLPFRDDHQTVIDDFIDSLEELGVLRKEQMSIGGKPLLSADLGFLRKAGIQVSDHASVVSKEYLVEKIRLKLISGIIEWCRNSSFLSYRGSLMANIDDVVVKFNSYGFDAVGYCFQGGIAKRNPGDKIKPVPVVIDVLPQICNELYASSFLERYSFALKGNRVPVVGVMVARGFHRDPMLELKRRGVFPWITDELLGKTTTESIKKVIEMSERLSGQLAISPEHIFEALNGFENFGQTFGEIKGYLFHVLVAAVFREKGYHTTLSWKAEGFDIDVLAENDTQVLFVECKGEKKENWVPAEQVHRHVHVRMPHAIRKWQVEHPGENRMFHSVVVASGEIVDANNEDGTTINGVAVALWNRAELKRNLPPGNASTYWKIIERFF